MVLIKLFGVLDLFAVATILLIHYGVLQSWRVIFFFAFYLILKGVAFWGSIHSIIDIIAGFWTVMLAIITPHTIISWLFAVYLAQKGVMSLA